MAIWCPACAVSVAGPRAYEGHLLAHHPEQAARGLCRVCAGVFKVEHSSEGARLVSHGEKTSPCLGSGDPPHRSTIKEH